MTDNDDILAEIFSKVLLIDKSELTDSIRRKEHEAWDSMAHLVLVTEIESEFGIFFEDEEVIEMWTLEDVKKILATKL